MDVLALDKRKSYVGVLKNGIQSERYASLSAVSYLGLYSTVRCYKRINGSTSRGLSQSHRTDIHNSIFLDRAPSSLAVEC